MHVVSYYTDKKINETKQQNKNETIKTKQNKTKQKYYLKTWFLHAALIPFTNETLEKPLLY